MMMWSFSCLFCFLLIVVTMIKAAKFGNDVGENTGLFDSTERTHNTYQSFSDLSGGDLTIILDDENLSYDSSVEFNSLETLTSNQSQQLPRTPNSSNCCASLMAGGAVIVVLAILFFVVAFFNN